MRALALVLFLRSACAPESPAGSGKSYNETPTVPVIRESIREYRPYPNPAWAGG